MNTTHNGFTLIEMMVAVAISAIILSVGLPSFTQIVKNGRISSAATCLTGAVYTARSEAVKRNASVTVCPSGDDASSCGDDWSNGVLVFSEGSSAATTPDLIAADVDADSTVIRVCPPANEDLSISATGSTDRTAARATDRLFIRYARDGSSNWSLGYFAICDDRDKEKWKALNVGLSGDIRVARFNEGNTALLDAFNRSISTC